MKVPTKIKALGDVKVKYKAIDAAGLYLDGVITIDTGSPAEKAGGVLGHELIHYALDKGGISRLLVDLGDKPDNFFLEEGIVTAIQKFLLDTGVFVLNPKKVSSWQDVKFKEQLK